MGALSAQRTLMVNMNTLLSSDVLDQALAGLEKDIRGRLIDAYLRVRRAYSDANFDNVGQRAGFFCECTLRAIQWELRTAYTPFGTRLPNFHDECVRLQASAKTAGSESMRILIPRAIDFVYTLRNKRGIGHVGGDVDANEIDAATCLRVCDWCVCELMRHYHKLSLEEAQAILDAVSIRELPHIWRVAGKRRVMANDLDYKSKVLLLLHGELDSTALAEDLCAWVEHPRLADFRKRVLKPLHEQRLIEYDLETQSVILSPRGAERVEHDLLKR
jgi:hypothetical protein